MKTTERSIVVIGAGLAGLTTALELTRRGLDVTVLEAREDVALETSHANGSMLTPSASNPWNAPGVHRHLAASLFDPSSSMRLRPSAIPSLFSWGLKFLRHSSPSRHRAATRANFILGRYSVECMRELRKRLPLEYDAATRGTMKLFRDEQALSASRRIAQDLESLGLSFEVLDRAGAVAAEPALEPIRQRIVAAIRFPDDESGDALKFCQGIAREIATAGGRVLMGQRVEGIETRGGQVSGVRTQRGLRPATDIVVATASDAPKMLRSFGIRLPVAPVKGYTVTFDVARVERRPSTPVLDEAMHAAVVPVGDRLRLAGTAEFAGRDFTLRQRYVDGLKRVLAEIYPNVASRVDQSTAKAWTALRPMSADGLPFIGATRVAGLFVNIGHGHLGWTQAAGSAKLLVDLLVGKAPGIDPTPYRPMRHS